MIGLYSTHADTFALGFAVVSSLAFALPFIVAPEKWGLMLRWSIPADVDLMRYFARTLGLLALSVNGVAVWMVLVRPDLLPAYFIMLTIFCAAMVPLHVYGWWRGQQPMAETAEIPFWAALTFACLVFFPVGG